MAKELPCLFCEHPSDQHRILFETEHFWVRHDNFPVSIGHVEIVSQRHVPDLLSLNEDERQDFWKVLNRTRKALERAYLPDGFNYGLNEGIAAGQTVIHLHVHVFPRYQGDVPNPPGPRGGVRNFKKPEKEY